MISRILMAAALAVTAVGCSNAQYERTRIQKTGGDSEAEVRSGRLLVPRGGVLMIEVKPEAAGSVEYKGWEEFELYSDDTSVAEIRPTIVRDAWLVNGRSVGSGTIRVVLDGDTVDTIDVDVEEVTR